MNAIDQEAYNQASRELARHLNTLIVQGMPIYTVIELIARTTAGIAITARLAPAEEEAFIDAFSNCMRIMFDRRQDLEILIEREAER